ncbi:unnamed protein product [Linum trigynum]|uniref:Uncharacterized protein n=1 Tax=Linum trigynum TaxID=586398 RepID=A0AAV2ER28_9ROSI
MVSTKSMKAAEKAAQAAEKGTDAGDGGLDGVVEDLTEIEELRKVVETQTERQARMEEELNGLQAKARDHGRTLDALLAAVEAFQGQVSSLTEAWKNGGAGAGGGGQPWVEGGAPGEGSSSVAALGGQGAERVSTDREADESGEKGGSAAANPNRTPVSRTGHVSFGPTTKDGLLPTPTAQEVARARGKAKMAEYVDPDLQTGLDGEELVDLEQEFEHGPWPNELYGLGADHRGDEGSQVGRSGMEGGPGGGRREAGRGWRMGRPGAVGRSPSGRGDMGRAGPSRAPLVGSNSVGPNSVEPNPAGPDWVEPWSNRFTRRDTQPRRQQGLPSSSRPVR